MIELEAYRAGDKSVSGGMEVTLGINRDAGTINPGQSIKFDYGIAGIGFLSGTHDQHPYQRGLAQVLKQAINSSTTPGDQSLDAFWLRSQTDWTAGAGTKYMEPITEDKIQRSFYRSYGIDPWTQGQVSLLKQSSSFASITTASTVPVHSIWVSDGYFVSSADTVTKVSSSGTKTTVTGLTASENVTNLVVGNGVVYVSTTAAVYQIVAGSTVAAKVFTVPTAGVDTRVWFSKDRLIITSGGAVWDEAPPAAGAGTTALAYVGALYQKSASTTWVACTSIPNAVLLADSSQSGSNIYRLTLDTTGAIPVLAAPVTVAEFPSNERITYLNTYLGGYLGIATNLGVRIGTVDSIYGTISYGPRIGSPIATGGFSAFDRFLFYPVADAGESRSGVVRIDLSEVDATGRAAWAMDQRIPAFLGYTVDTVTVKEDGSVLMGARATSTVELFKTAAVYEDYGFLSTGAIREGTSEQKYFDTINIQVNPDWQGSVSVTALGDFETTMHVGTFTPASGSNLDLRINAIDTFTHFSVGITLVSSDDNTASPILQSWNLRALPAVKRQRLIQAVLLAFDHEADMHSVPYGYEGYAIERVRALEDQVKDGWPFTFQDFNSGETYRATLESIQFTEISPPSNASGFGGVIDLTIRTL